MIAPNKAANAMYALQGILIRARFLAATDEQAGWVSSLLDYAENLTRLFVGPTGETARYRSILLKIGGRYDCDFALNSFDEPVPAVW